MEKSLQKTKAVLFCRVSSKEQEDTGYSLDAQEKLLNDYAEKNGYTIAKIFRISESASGKQIRTSFLEMLRFATKNNVPIILCEKIDRLTRNLKDASIVDEWVKESARREVHFVKESFVLNGNTKAHENLVWDMKVAIARFYTNNLSEEVRKGVAEKIRQGWLPTTPPLGYTTIGEKGHKTHIVSEKKAPLVREMFELYSTGNYSLKALAEILFKKGLRNNAGTKLIKSRIHQLLSDPFYYGKLRWKDVIYDGKQEPLISKKLFDMVQTKLARKTKSPAYQKHLPVFKAMIDCDECGGMMTWEIQRGHWYGHCNHYRECSQKQYTRQESVEEQLFPYFDKVAPISNDALEILNRAIKESHAEKIQEHTSLRDTITQQTADLDRRLEKLYDDKVDNKITPEFYLMKFKKWTAEKDALLETLNNLSEANIKYYMAGYAIHEIAQQSARIYNSSEATIEDKRILLSYVFQDHTMKEGRVNPNYTLAFKFLVDWMPKVNKIFEPTKKPARSEVIHDKAVTVSEILRNKLMEPQKHFRTSKNSTAKPRFAFSAAESRLLLPG